jgi:signal transduction histidine kinase
VFFNRASRPPPWASATRGGRYPVVTVKNPAIAPPILDRIRAQAASRVTYAHFDTVLRGVPYQIVARLQYEDAYRERLDSVTGFTVNLAWVRDRYFLDVVSEVSQMGESNAALEYAVFDDHNVSISGTADGVPAALRQFPLQFFDPAATELGADDDILTPVWTLRVSSGESPPLEWAAAGADTTLLAIAGTALGLAISFLLTAQSVRTRASLAAMRAEFVSIATHELKTPLATIRAASETMVRGRLAGDRLAEYARLLLQESKRLTRLVDNLLAYARVIDVRDLYQFEPLSPAELIEDAVGNFERQLSEAHFDVSTDVPHDLPLVRGDRTTLRLALENLIDNAMRYSETTKSLRLTARHTGSWLTIEVTDRGPGIAADDIQRVKARFVRGRRSTTRGSGLGLAIVSRVVSDHGGRFDLQSTVGSGTTAIVTLPIDGD